MHDAPALHLREPAAPSGAAGAFPPAAGDTAGQIATVASDLRARLTPLLAALAGVPPRPVRLMRGIGLNKSLASRLVKATSAESDPQFLHRVPSPTGLRILLDKAHGQVDADLLQAAEAAVNRFEALIDTLPGGRQTLDARIGASQAEILGKREQVARQASFKAVSFLFGHYCETLATTLFIVPSATPGRLDYLEIHRRIGLHRLLPDAPIPLMSLQPLDVDPRDPGAPCVTGLAGDPAARRPEDFLLPWASTPMPELRIVDEGTMTTFVLDPTPSEQTPARVTTAIRFLRACEAAPAQAFDLVRRYMLHTPCKMLVRDVFVAKGVWPEAQLHVGFYLPGPTGSPSVITEPGRRHHRQLHLTCRVEPLPAGPQGFELPGVADHGATAQQVLDRLGLGTMAFRGWRCTMSYPVPLVEMQIAFRFDSPA